MEAAFFFVRSALSEAVFTDADCWRIVYEAAEAADESPAT